MATRTLSRPAQGNNSIAPLRRPRPAYRPSLAPQVVSSGTLSRPKDTVWRGSTLKRQAADETPKIVTL